MTPDPIAEGVVRGDARAVARAISLVEDEGPAGAELIRAIYSRTGRAYLVGVTGPPGAGKSTLVDRLTAKIRSEGKSVGVIAVDPTSPFTGGAILGDRVRMGGHASDPGVFIRSMATRGHLGGLARATSDVALVLDASGKDVIVIETVGVGQDEVEIVRTADISIVMLVPGTGDDVQALKAGIMEIADIFVVNKADRDGADALAQSIAANLSLQTFAPGEWRPPIIRTQATADVGTSELWTDIGRFREGSTAGRTARQRDRQAFRLREVLSQRVLRHIEASLPAGELDRIVDRLVARELDPYTAADEIAQRHPAMKAILDHIGIAVRDVEAALAFYRDALGLEVEAPEDVPSQRVRAHFVPVGQSALELLEATASDSAIAKYIEKRGPGIHHITLRVEDIRAALAQLKARGVRLVDDEPRPGAEGALVAFVHPSAAHGVLVELKERGRVRLDLSPKRLSWGELELISVNDGLFRLDGGAMFGVVPRPLWEKKAPPDDRNRIQLSMRPLVVEGSWGRMMIDCGAGDKWDAKALDIYAFDRTRHLDHALRDVELTAASIDIVLATHLHFDHFGGATRGEGAALVPRFVNARYMIRAAEWDDATHPHERNRASYLEDDFVPLKGAGVVDFYEDDGIVKPGVRVERTGGHTGQHQIVYIESGGRTAVFTADLIPTTAHIHDAWIMGYDLFPMQTLAVKKRVIRDAMAGEHLIFFEHDPLVAAGYIREKDGRRYVEPVL